MHLEGDLGLVIVAQGPRLVVVLGLQRSWQLDDDRSGHGCFLDLPCDQHLQNTRRSGEARVEQLLCFLFAAGVAQPRGGAQHGEQRRTGADQQ
jgi:hypothetical protein